MTSDKFYELFGEIDSDFVDFAENYKFKKRINLRPFLKFGAVAAVVAIVVCLTPVGNLLSFILGGGAGSVMDSAAPEATATPETGMISSDQNECAAPTCLLIEASGKTAAKLTISRAENVAVIGMEPTGNPLEFRVDANESGWTARIIVSGDADDFDFEFTDPGTGNPIEIDTKSQMIKASEIEKYKNDTP